MYKIKSEIDENEAQKAVQIEANKRIKPDNFPRQALADRKPNILLVHRNKKQEKEKTYSQIRYGGDPTMITVDQAEDIDTYMRFIEQRYKIPKQFLRANRNVDGRMRQILVDWLVHVQDRFTLQSETLSLAVNLLDRSLIVMNGKITKNNLQLLGVSCLFVAAKFEEIFIPNTEDFVLVAANVFTKEEIYQMEQQILATVNFDLGQPHSIQFLRRYRFYINPEQHVYNFAKYVCEVTLVSYELAHYQPSTVAAVAIWLSSYTFGRTLDSKHLFDQIFKLDIETVSKIAQHFIEAVLQFADPAEQQLYALRQKHQKRGLDKLSDLHINRLYEFLDFGSYDSSKSTLIK